jgi:hypothetical protein
LTFPNLTLFVFSLKDNDVYGYVKMKMDGSTISVIYNGDADVPNRATITGTAVITMNKGQKVSDSLLFLCCMKLTIMHYLYQSIHNIKQSFSGLISFCFI